MIHRAEAGTNRDFTSAELDEKRSDDARGTSDALNRARRAAGQHGADVAVHGEDGALNQALEKKTHVAIGESVSAGVDALEISGALGIHVPVVSKALHGHVGISLAGVATLAGIQVAMWEMQKTKDGRRDAATRDALHAGMLMSLELPSGFVDAEVARLGVGTRNTDSSVKVKNEIASSPLAAELQLQCDQGVLAAEDFLRSGKGTKEAFFAMSRKTAERYAEDAVFRAGFDALVWANQNAPEETARLLVDVQARDARDAAAHSQCRI
jgi:hypothetical protein